ncbi:tetratricopeptide repeat protein [Flavobacterium sp. W1B]|uniref:tetratricopeptide repeat protein n=1 Tax=Flavobacterium sp. W1B TaxID=3394146 RepID=UPI0039BD5FE6
MRKLFLSKLFLVSSIFLLFVYGVIYACGGGEWFEDWYYGYNSNFTPEAFVDKSYSPLFLSGEVFYGIGFDAQHNSRFNDEITADWQSFLKEKMNPDEVKAFLLDNNRKIKVEELYFFFKTKEKNESSIGFASKINLKDAKTKEFIRFLYLAQQIETVSIGEEHWGYEPVVSKVFTDLELIKEIENKYNTTKDAFLKNRYWFQTIKAYFYSDDRQKAIDFFNKTAASVPKNTLYYRAVGYLAGIYYKQKNYAVSNYLYSQVFDKCPPMRVVAAYSFHPQEEADWNQSLAMAENNQEKAALWAIHGFYKDEVNAISNIFELDPSSEHLNYLLTRLINGQENKINANYKDKSVSENKKSQLANMDKSVLALVNKITASNATHEPYLWSIALGYLQTLNGEYTKADKTFDAVAPKLPKTDLASNQLRLLRFVNNLNKISVINPASEKTILNDLHWLYKELPKKNIESFRYHNATNWSKLYLSALYKAKNNNVMAELFVATEGFYDNDKNLQAMKDFLSKSNKTEMEVIANSVYNLKLKDINAFQATKATFENKIPEAIAFMQKTDSLQYVKFPGNPFNGNIKDCHDCEHAAHQKKKFTQIEFLKLIKEMQDKVVQNEDVYNNCLLLGNAFYNITHFGNARLFHEGAIAGFGSSPTFFRDPIKKMIVDCSLSKMYYRKAFEAATTKEQKAKCVYLLAKCERNEFYNNRYYFQNKNWWDMYDDKVNFLAWDGFKKLEKDYSDTKYYQEVIAECGYFRTYINRP